MWWKQLSWFFDEAQLCATSLDSLIEPGVLNYFIHFFFNGFACGLLLSAISMEFYC